MGRRGLGAHLDRVTAHGRAHGACERVLQLGGRRGLARHVDLAVQRVDLVVGSPWWRCARGRLRPARRRRLGCRVGRRGRGACGAAAPRSPSAGPPDRRRLRRRRRRRGGVAAACRRPRARRGGVAAAAARAPPPGRSPATARRDAEPELGAARPARPPGASARDGPLVVEASRPAATPRSRSSTRARSAFGSAERADTSASHAAAWPRDA